MKRLTTIAAVIAIALAGIVAVPADAGRRWDKPDPASTPLAGVDSCSSARITLYENPNYGMDGGTTPFTTQCNATYLGNILADGDGCSAIILDQGNWNDCASSWKVTTPGSSGGCYHYGVNVYIDSNFGKLLWSTWGPKNFGGGFGFEDQMSSIQFKYRSVCPSSPAGQQPS